MATKKKINYIPYSTTAVNPVDHADYASFSKAYDDYVDKNGNKLNPRQKPTEAQFGTSKNVAKTSAAYQPAMNDSKSASLNDNKDMAKLVAARDQSDVDYGKTDDSKTKKQIETNLGIINNLIKLENDKLTSESVERATKETKPEQSPEQSPEDFDKAYMQRLRDRYDWVDDYYGDSMSGAFENLSDKDKRLLLFDAIATSVKNSLQSRLPMYSAYGKDYEGKEPGTEKSLAQQMLTKSMENGLQRRDKKLNAALDQQIKIANFPSDLKMQIAQAFESGSVSNRVKMQWLDMMKDTSISDAAKIGLTNELMGGVVSTAGAAIGSAAGAFSKLAM